MNVDKDLFGLVSGLVITLVSTAFGVQFMAIGLLLWGIGESTIAFVGWLTGDVFLIMALAMVSDNWVRAGFQKVGFFNEGMTIEERHDRVFGDEVMEETA